MGITYYLDPGAGSNTSPYDTWAKAATSIQTLADLAVAGDICYCRGTQTYAGATTIDFDTNAGTNAAGWIKFIGCNAAGAVDGTRFVINVNSKAVHGITLNGTADMVWFQNIEIKNAGAGGDAKNGFIFGTANSEGVVFVNCSFHNCSGSGIDAQYLIKSVLIQCTSYLNTQHGFYGTASGNRYLFCNAHDNTLDGWSYTGVHDVILGSVSYDNGDDGIGINSYNILIFNTVVNGNADNGIDMTAGTNLNSPIVVGCRITNQSGATDIGISAASDPLITMACYFEDNADDNIQNAEMHTNIGIGGVAATSNIEDQANTNEGYTDLTNDAQDFNLSSSASLRRTAITIPVL